MINVLYCGMADDIFSPLLFTPKVKTIFAIDLFDECYSSKGTWKSQKNDIKTVLRNGTNLGSRDRLRFKEEECESPAIYLKGPSTIISEKDDTKKKRWYLKFRYDDADRELVYFYKRNCLQTWPEEITEIRHLMVIGALDPNEFRDDKYTTFRGMMKQRCTRTFSIYARYVFFDRVSIVEGPFTIYKNNKAYPGEIDHTGKLTLTTDVVDVIFSNSNHFEAEDVNGYDNPEEESEYSEETEE